MVLYGANIPMESHHVQEAACSECILRQSITFTVADFTLRNLWN